MSTSSEQRRRALEAGEGHWHNRCVPFLATFCPSSHHKHVTCTKGGRVAAATTATPGLCFVFCLLWPVSLPLFFDPTVSVLLGIDSRWPLCTSSVFLETQRKKQRQLVLLLLLAPRCVRPVVWPCTTYTHTSQLVISNSPPTKRGSEFVSERAALPFPSCKSINSPTNQSIKKQSSSFSCRPFLFCFVLCCASFLPSFLSVKKPLLRFAFSFLFFLLFFFRPLVLD